MKIAPVAPNSNGVSDNFVPQRAHSAKTPWTLKNPDNPMQQPDSDICGATTRNGSKCQRPAGWGTDQDEGRCKQHGGSGGRPPKHGRYAAERSESLQRKIQEYRKDPNPSEMWEELALLRAVLQEWLTDMDEVTEESVSVLLDLQNSIRRTLDSINKIQSRTALTAAEVEYLQARIADLFNTYIPPAERDNALDELEEIVETNEQRSK